MEAGPRGGHRVLPPELGIADDVHHDGAVLVEGVQRVEDVARRDVEPTDVAVRPPARHDADAGAVLVAPPVRHPARHRQAEVEDHGQVHEHDVPLGDGEVVDHGRARHRDDRALHEPSVGIGAVIHEVGRQIRVAEEMELARSRAELRMGGHRRGEASTEVEATDRLQLARHLGGERRLDQHATLVLYCA